MAAASYPDFHVTGAVHHYIRTPGTSGNILYLGTAEVTPRVEHRPMYEDTFNDITGTKVPAQRTEQGEMAVIGVLLNRYSKSAYDYLAQLTGAAWNRGRRGRFSRGSLVFGRSSFELWQVFENYLSPAFQTTGLEIGYYWPQCTMGPHTRDRLGTDTEKLLLVMEAYEKFTPQSSVNSVASGERQFYLYSQSDDTTTFPAAVRVPQ